MDFLATVKQRLQELEEQARLAGEAGMASLEAQGVQFEGRGAPATQERPLFQPRSKGNAAPFKSAKGSAPAKSDKKSGPGQARQASRAPGATAQSKQPGSESFGFAERPASMRGLASNEAFSTPECATSGGALGAPVGPSMPQANLRRSLVNDLHGRLDEAFLLSEILGPPRCVRGWNDD